MRDCKYCNGRRPFRDPDEEIQHDANCPILELADTEEILDEWADLEAENAALRQEIDARDIYISTGKAVMKKERQRVRELEEGYCLKDKLPPEYTRVLFLIPGVFEEVADSWTIGMMGWEYPDTEFGISSNKIYHFFYDDEDETPIEDTPLKWMPLPPAPEASE